MVAKQESDLFYLWIFPKCPFFGSITALLIIVMLITLGTIGMSYLNYWAAVGYLSYSLLFYFFAMPQTMCKYCYFKIKESTTNEEKGEPIENLLPVDQWSKSFLHMHVGQKGWSYAMAIVWLAPIFLIGASLFLNFSLSALLALFGFLVVLVSNFFFMVRIKCPTCSIQKQCYSSFGGTIPSTYGATLHEKEIKK